VLPKGCDHNELRVKKVYLEVDPSWSKGLFFSIIHVAYGPVVMTPMILFAEEMPGNR
jgi:hypothetical protein